MPPDFTIYPKLDKGALQVYESDEQNTPSRTIVFQYNPTLLKRSLTSRTEQKQAGDAGGAREDVMRVAGPPVETINLTVELDAVDQPTGVAGLNEQRPSGQQKDTPVPPYGLHTALATLDMLLYPTAFSTKNIEAEAEKGAVQLKPNRVPLTLLHWGRMRVVPVLLTSFSVTEEAFDRYLNPIQAKVELGMRVLTYMELQKGSVGWKAFLDYQLQKERFSGREPLPSGTDTGGAPVQSMVLMQRAR